MNMATLLTVVLTIITKKKNKKAKERTALHEDDDDQVHQQEMMIMMVLMTMKYLGNGESVGDGAGTAAVGMRDIIIVYNVIIMTASSLATNCGTKKCIMVGAGSSRRSGVAVAGK